MDAPDCCTPKARPWRCSETSRLSRALTAGPPMPLATPPSTSRPTSPAAEWANSATVVAQATTSAAASRIPRTPPMRSTRRPQGIELSAETT